MLRLMKFICALAFVAWAAGSTHSSLAFDVSAYKDPRSEARVGSQNNVTLGNCNEDYWAPNIPRYDSTDYAYWVNAVEEANREAMRLYAEMGMTNLMVCYKNEDFDLLEDIPFKVMNDWWANRRFRYPAAHDMRS